MSSQRFCMLKKEYMESFEAIFKEQYDTIHRLETNKLRNVAKMFAHLLYTDSIPWSVSKKGYCPRLFLSIINLHYSEIIYSSFSIYSVLGTTCVGSKWFKYLFRCCWTILCCFVSSFCPLCIVILPPPFLSS